MVDANNTISIYDTTCISTFINTSFLHLFSSPFYNKKKRKEQARKHWLGNKMDCPKCLFDVFSKAKKDRNDSIEQTSTVGTSPD